MMQTNLFQLMDMVEFQATQKIEKYLIALASMDKLMLWLLEELVKFYELTENNLLSA